MPDDLPECLTCGACCFSELPTYVRVTGDDHSRLGERADELVWFDGIRAHLRMADGRCAALEIQPESGRFVCGVYELRPALCRDLGRGSPECRAERAAKLERPLLALARVRALSGRSP